MRQYFWGNGLQYRGEKRAIIHFFEDHYVPVQTTDTGLIRIRFVVNCQGKTDRFRWMGMDRNYDAMKFDERTVDQLISIAKRSDGWFSFERNGISQDYYQYLIFKIEKGHIEEILP